MRRTFVYGICAVLAVVIGVFLPFFLPYDERTHAGGEHCFVAQGKVYPLYELRKWQVSSLVSYDWENFSYYYHWGNVYHHCDVLYDVDMPSFHTIVFPKKIDDISLFEEDNYAYDDYRLYFDGEVVYSGSTEDLKLFHSTSSHYMTGFGELYDFIGVSVGGVLHSPDNNTSTQEDDIVFIQSNHSDTFSLKE